jgi:MoxR-like ATPase
LTTDQLLALQNDAANVYTDPALIEYGIKLVAATRNAKDIGLKDIAHYITFGASPRASINLILAGRALAFVRGRTYTLPQDVVDIALDVIRHRLVLSYEALSDNVSSDDLLKRIMSRIPVPEVPLHEHAKIRVNA